MASRKNLRICVRCNTENFGDYASCKKCKETLEEKNSISYVLDNWSSKCSSDYLAYTIKVDNRIELIQNILELTIIKEDNISREIIDILSLEKEWERPNQLVSYEFLLKYYFNKIIKDIKNYPLNSKKVLDILYLVTLKSDHLGVVLNSLNNTLQGREVISEGGEDIKRAKEAIIYLLGKAEKDEENNPVIYFKWCIEFLKETDLDWDIFDLIREKVLVEIIDLSDFKILANKFNDINEDYKPYLIALVMYKRERWKDSIDAELRKRLEEFLSTRSIWNALLKFKIDPYTSSYKGHPNTLLLLRHLWAVYCICVDFSKDIYPEFDRCRLLEAAHFHDLGKIIHILFRDHWPMLNQERYMRSEFEEMNKNLKEYTRLHVAKADIFLGSTFDLEVLEIIKNHHFENAEGIAKEIQVLKIVDCVNRGVEANYHRSKIPSSITIKEDLKNKSEYGEEMVNKFLDYVEKKVNVGDFLRFGRHTEKSLVAENRQYMRFPVEQEIYLTIFQKIGKEDDRKITVLLEDINLRGVFLIGTYDQITPRLQEKIILGKELGEIPKLVIKTVGPCEKVTNSWEIRAEFENPLPIKILREIVNYSHGNKNSFFN